VAKWRETVKSSIENEEPMYVRDTVYDRLLGLLFPEMRSALNNSFGTPLQILEKDYDTTEDLPEPPKSIPPKLDCMGRLRSDSGGSEGEVRNIGGAGQSPPRRTAGPQCPSTRAGDSANSRAIRGGEPIADAIRLASSG